jgi:hypothetical protein
MATQFTLANYSRPAKRAWPLCALGLVAISFMVSINEIWPHQHRRNMSAPAIRKVLPKDMPTEVEIWTYPVPPPEVAPNSNRLFICSYESCRRALSDKGIPHFPLDLKSLTSNPTAPVSYRKFIGDQHFFKVLHELDFPHHVQMVALVSFFT